MPCHYTGHLVHGPIEVVVDDHMMGQFAPDRFLFATELDPTLDLIRRVTPSAHALDLGLHRRRDYQDDHRVRTQVANLAGTVEVDLEHEIPAGRRVWKWRARELTRHYFGPFEEATVLNGGLEGRPPDEVICVGGLARSPITGRPGPTQPERVIPRHQTVDDRPLPHPTRPGDHEDRAPGIGPTDVAVTRNRVWAQDREGSFSNSACR